jgi:uncharacterized protein YndB with AHSA1/START domain
MTTQTYTLRASIGAPPEAVYAALADAAALRAWLAEHAEVALDRGVYQFWGRYTPEGERGRQRLLEFQPGRRLSFSWRLQGAETGVAIALEPQDGGTSLTLTHSGVPPRPSGDRYWVRDLLMLSLAKQGRTHLTIVHSGFGGGRRTEGYQLGWMEFLASLKRLHEVGAGWRPVEQVAAPA